jgi:urease accessory protein UreF
MLLQPNPDEARVFSDAADWRAIEEKLGSPEDATSVSAVLFSPAIKGIRNLEELKKLLHAFQHDTMAAIELPTVLKAYHHATRGEARELIALDQSLGNAFQLEALANASRRVGRSQLRRLRSMKDQRLIQRYWDAVEANKASGWHTIVFGVALAIYSIPLRQGLHHYAGRTLRGFIDSGAAHLRLAESAATELEESLASQTPALIERLLSNESPGIRCV